MRELPEAFCWTKYGAEAGEAASSILRRKELERLATGGIFLWGIGNAIGPSLEQLLGQACEPKVALPRCCLGPQRRTQPRRESMSGNVARVWTGPHLSSRSTRR
jgi:hypothetical protein